MKITALLSLIPKLIASRVSEAAAPAAEVRGGRCDTPQGSPGRALLLPHSLGLAPILLSSLPAPRAPWPSNAPWKWASEAGLSESTPRAALPPRAALVPLLL